MTTKDIKDQLLEMNKNLIPEILLKIADLHFKVNTLEQQLKSEPDPMEDKIRQIEAMPLKHVPINPIPSDHTGYINRTEVLKILKEQS